MKKDMFKFLFPFFAATLSVLVMVLVFSLPVDIKIDTPLVYGATILTTDESDTIGTFRTNVNTSLTNLNTALDSAAFPFTSTTNFGQTTNSTSTAVWMTASPYSFMASSTAVLTYASTTQLTVSSNTYLTGITSALVLTGSDGLVAEYAGTSCTNQVITVLSALGVATCSSINNGYWSGTDLSVANGGTGLSTFGGTNTVLYTTAADTLASEAAFTYNSSTNLLSFDFASTTAVTASGELVVPRDKTLANAGEITTDDTSGQFRWFANSSQNVAMPYYPIGFSFATTTPGTGTTTRYLSPARAALTITKARCESNTFYQVSLYDGTNRADMIMASSTIGTITYTTNNTFTANESMRVDIGTTTAPSGTAYLSCGFDYKYTAD